MCGVIAIVGSQVKASATTQLALDALAHRGPDNVGEWNAPSGCAWLGHRRLSIVDLSPTGNQPMYNEDKSVWVVGNGEIYNFPTLRERLEGLGHRFYSNCDSEVILHAYELWDEDCVDHLRGMFAFVLWDEHKRKLLAARDPVGIKPLYYAGTGQGLVLASEAGALLPFLEPTPQPEPLALAYVLTLGYVPSPWCIWTGIRKLEPGYILVWRPGESAQVRRYWEPPRRIEGERYPTAEDLRIQFEPVLEEHLLSDVPIGLFLSGGLDSTSVAAGLRDLGHLIQALTVGFPGSAQSEVPAARMTAAHLGFPHQAIPLRVDDVNDLLGKVAAAYDEPQGYSAPLSMYLLCEIASDQFKVVLAGDGGDELFGGYTWYQRLKGLTGKPNQFLYQRLVGPRVGMSASPGIRRVAMWAFSHSSVLHRHAWRLFPRFLPEEVESLLAPMGVRFGEDEMLEPFRRHFEPSLPLRRALQRVDLMTFCTDSILAKVDRASMAHSLEVRVPWLDRRMIEWALSHPPDPREEKKNKPVLRDYLRSRVLSEVLKRPKQGFSLRVLHNFDWSQAIDMIRQGPWVQQRMWASGWEQLLAPGVPYREARIWVLLCLTRWAESWLL